MMGLGVIHYPELMPGFKVCHSGGGASIGHRSTKSELLAVSVKPRARMMKSVAVIRPVPQTTQTFESTATLLRKVKQGDADAKERLFAIYLPLLTRWAHGRLPVQARSLSETADMVQLTLFKALQKLPEFEHRGEGAFLAYLRQVLLNSVRKEIQKQQRRHQLAPMDSDQVAPDGSPSVLDQVIGQRVLGAYENALQQLPEREREAVILRLELDFSFPEIAESLELNSANAARMLVTRSFDKLARHMPHE